MLSSRSARVRHCTASERERTPVSPRLRSVDMQREALAARRRQQRAERCAGAAPLAAGRRDTFAAVSLRCKSIMRSTKLIHSTSDVLVSTATSPS